MFGFRSKLREAARSIRNKFSATRSTSWRSALPATITIGRSIPAPLLADFVEVIVGEALSVEWDDPGFTKADLPVNGALGLLAHDVAQGCFEALEAFCKANALPFALWSGAYGGGRGAERLVFTGVGEPRSYVADEGICIFLDLQTIDLLATIDQVGANFAAAGLAIPPPRLVE